MSIVDPMDALLRAVAQTPDAAIPRAFTGTDRYRLKRSIGEGSFGTVYEAEDRDRSRPVALKLLKGAGPSLSTAIRRFKAEFRSVANIVHPNLVGLHELVSDGGHWFFTMDLVDGENFRSYVSGDEAAYDETRLRDALAQLVSGVSAIHAAGMMHRDLKPSNVLVDRQGRVVILDFGLAADTTPRADASTAQVVAGTPAYMAPEQAHGAPETASDWYAVGVMLYQALTGSLPSHRAARPCTAAADLDELCERLLREDHCERPTSEELASLFRAPVRPTRPQAPTAELTGRESELAKLRDGLDALRGGRSSSILVGGAAGVGKSALCAHFVREVADRGEAVVLAGRCHERESVPFKAFDDVIDALCRYLRELPRRAAAGLMPRDIHLVARLFPAVGGVEATQDVPRRSVEIPDRNTLRRRAFAAMKELLGRIADRQPLVLFIDDLQWGDVDSARLFVELLGPPNPPRLLFVGSYRDEEIASSPMLSAIVDPHLTDDAYRLALGPLPPVSAKAVALRILGADADRGRVAAIVDESVGHPMFLEELCRWELAGDGRASSRTTLGELIIARVSELGEAAQQLLETVAVAGRPLTQRLCLEAAGLEATQASVVTMLRTQHLVRTAGPSADDLIETYHDRIRETVVASLEPTRARARHLGLAEVLERTAGADPQAVASHFDSAGDARRASRFAIVAADTAADALAFDRAAGLYRMAVGHAQGEPSRELQSKLAQALLNAGRGAEAGRVYLEAATQATGLDALDLRRQGAEHLLASGQGLQEGREEMMALLETLGLPRPLSHGRIKIRIGALSLKLRFFGNRFKRKAASECSREALLRLDTLESAAKGLEFYELFNGIYYMVAQSKMARKLGEPHRVARAMANLAPVTTALSGMNQGAQRVTEHAEKLARELDNPRALAEVFRMRGVMHGFACGDFRGGLEWFERAEALLLERCQGVMRDIRYTRKKSLHCLLRLGRFDALRRLGADHYRDGVERGDGFARTFAQVYGLVPIYLADDDTHRAHAELDRISLPEGSSVVRIGYVTAVNKVLLYTDQIAELIEFWEEQWPLVQGSCIDDIGTFRVEVARARAAAYLAAGPDQMPIVEQMMKLIKPLHRRCVFASPTLSGVRGCVAAVRGDNESARRHFEAAAAQYAEQDLVLLAACARRQLGRLSDDAAVVGAADADIRKIGIVRPDRWADMYFPGLGYRR